MTFAVLSPEADRAVLTLVGDAGGRGTCCRTRPGRGREGGAGRSREPQDFRVAGVYCIDVNFIEDALGSLVASIAVA